MVEMLTVITIIVILVALILAMISTGRERGRRIGCLNNLRQLMQASLMYADDDAEGNLSTAIHDTNDVLSFLYPTYVANLNVFICPSSENEIRSDQFVTNPLTGQKELYDLTGYAGSITNAGTSYELFGFMNHTPDTPNYTDVKMLGGRLKVRGVKKTLSSIQSYRHMYDTFGLKGTVPGPSAIWLIPDGDEPPGRQNFPDPNNNHGDEGSNVAFCDGHVEWIPTKRYLYRYELSQDENRSRP